LGAVRKQELYYSCSVLGIERGCVSVIDDARLPDGMAAVWPLEVVAEHVEAAVRKYSASIVSY
jgi:LmbE family N-acetylglucosaminyl deacetylase